jgi:Mg2+/Co2+ transporter CorB
VVAAITYLSLIIGELVPNRLALNGPEAVSSHVARPMRFLTILASPGVPGVWLLSASTEVVLRLLGARRSEDPPVTEQEFEALLARLAFSTPRRCPGSQRRMRLAGKGSVALLATVSATRARHRSRSAERFDLTLHG